MQRQAKTAEASAVVLTVLLLCVGCNRDEKEFAAARQADTVAAYEEFVAKYPDNERVAEAQREIARLTEKADYEAAVAANNVTAWEAFVARYPKSSHAADVAAAIENLLANMIQGRISDQLRGWTAEGHMLVEVPIPLPPTGGMNLGKFELRSGKKSLARCVGLVPPEDFWGGLSGRVSEERSATPLPVAGLQPANPVEPATGSTNILFNNFYYPARYEDSLIAGEEVVVERVDKEGFSVASSGTTFLLLEDGFHVRSERAAASRTAGFKVPLENEIVLLFVVEPLDDSFVQLVAGDEPPRDVRLGRDGKSSPDEMGASE